MLRKRSPFFKKEEGSKPSDRLMTSTGTIIQEKIIEKDGRTTFK